MFLSAENYTKVPAIRVGTRKNSSSTAIGATALRLDEMKMARKKTSARASKTPKRQQDPRSCNEVTMAAKILDFD